MLRFVVAALLAASPALADDAARAEAKALLLEGNALLDKGDAAGALAKFRAAHDRYASPRLLLNIGTALRMLHRDVEAARAYDAALRSSDADLTPELRAEVMTNLAELGRHLVRFVVTVSEDGARVTVDGEAIGASPLGGPVWVAPGSHRIEASKSGFAVAQRDVETKPGAQEAIGLTLAPVRSISAAPSDRVPDRVPVPVPVPVAVPGSSPSPSPSTTASTLTTTTTNPESTGTHWYRAWWFWTAAGVVLAGAVTTAALASGGGGSTTTMTPTGPIYDVPLH